MDQPVPDNPSLVDEDSSGFSHDLSSLSVNESVTERKRRTREFRRRKWCVLWRRATAVVVVSFGGAVGIVAYGLLTAAAWPEIVGGAAAVLFGGPAAGLVAAFQVLFSMLAVDMRLEMKRQVFGRERAASVLPDRPWLVLRLLVFAGPSLIGGLVASDTGWSWHALACVLTGSIVAALGLWKASCMWGDGRIFD